jgi:hypothetical protein
MPSLMRIGAKHPSSQRDHCMFSKVGQIHYFRVVTPLWTTRESQHRSSERISDVLPLTRQKALRRSRRWSLQAP